jgi:hypothetical protein
VKKISQFTLREGSSLAVGEKVEVYYNLTQGGFSIVSRDKNNPNNGKVLAYAPYVQLENATFHLNLKKLEKIRTINRKTVYAVVRGIYKGAEDIEASDYTKGYCHPFNTGCFINYETGEELTEAKLVHFYDKFFSFKK